jgi:nucleotide sugar dehydrogenase
MKITVIGMGKIGLPLAVQFARKGHTVIGLDIEKKTVDSINAGIEPFPEERYLQEYLSDVVASGALTATLDAREAIHHSTHIVVVVPLFVDSSAKPDFASIDSAATEIGKYIAPGTLVAFETTLPVGTTRDRFSRIIADESGLEAGVDFFVVFSPERVLTGRVFEDLRKYPKIVGGLNNLSTIKGVEFYRNVLDFDENPQLPKRNGVWEVNNCEAAELVKLAETTYRDVNIGLANQFAMFANEQNIDISEVITAANSQPYSHIHTPGISVGGHCIPVYPQFFLFNSPDASIVRNARLANQDMPTYFVNKLESILGSLGGKNVLILGVSYREKVKEHAFSGVFDLVQQIQVKGGTPYVLDPLYSNSELESINLIELPSSVSPDAVLLHTAHKEFKDIQFENWGTLRAVVDGRRFFRISDIPEGVSYFNL